MNRYAIINDNAVVNVVLWDGETPYNPDGVLVLIPEEQAVDTSWSYANDEFIPPVMENFEEE